MRNAIWVAALASVALFGCSGSSSSSSSGSTGGSSTSTTSSGSTTGNTTSGSTGTTTSGSTGASTSSSTGGTTGVSTTSSSGSTGTTSSSGSTGGSSGSSGQDWSCLGNYQPPSTTQQNATLTLTFKDGLSGNANSGLVVSLCVQGTLHSDCTPTGTSTDATGTTDAQGNVTLNVTITSGSGYTGEVHVTDPNNSVLEHLVYLPPFGASTSYNVATISQTDLQLAGYYLTRNTVDMTTHGIITGTVSDCADVPASGATATVATTDTTTEVYYFSGGVPSASATATDASGDYLVANVPFGNQNIQLHNSSGTLTEGHTVDVIAGGVTAILGWHNY